MKRSKPIKETVIRTESVETAYESYEYTLLMRESQRVASFRIPLYSIIVKMKTEDGRETRSELTDAFCDVGKAVVFFDKLVENLATPLNLHYILEDETV